MAHFEAVFGPYLEASKQSIYLEKWLAIESTAALAAMDGPDGPFWAGSGAPFG